RRSATPAHARGPLAALGAGSGSPAARTRSAPRIPRPPSSRGSPPIGRTRQARSSCAWLTRVAVDRNELVEGQPLDGRRLGRDAERERPEERPRQRDVEDLLRLLGDPVLHEDAAVTERM